MSEERKHQGGKRMETFLAAERNPREFKNKGCEAWFYAGRGTFFFHSTFHDGPQRDIAVKTRMLIKALTELGLVRKARP